MTPSKRIQQRVVVFYITLRVSFPFYSLDICVCVCVGFLHFSKSEALVVKVIGYSSLDDLSDVDYTLEVSTRLIVLIISLLI